MRLAARRLIHPDTTLVVFVLCQNMARVMSCSCYRAKTEEEFNFRPNGRPRIGPHAKTEEETDLDIGMRLPRHVVPHAEEEETHSTKG